MDMGWGQAASAALQFTGGLIAGHRERSMQDENINFQREMWSKTNEWNKAMAEWELRNTQDFRAQDRDFAMQQALREYQRQKEFASMGLQWKVDDAKAAGLHPLAVLGGAGSMYSPTISAMGNYGVPSVRASSVSGGGSSGPDSLGAAITGMGQNLSRALLATETEFQRDMREEQLRNIRLQNDKLDAEILKEYSSIAGQPANPPFPSAAPEGAVSVSPSSVVSHAYGEPHLEAGSTPLTKRFNMGGGSYIDLPSQQASESLEALGPFAGPMVLSISGLRRFWHGPQPPSFEGLPPGYNWTWNPFSQSFRATPSYMMDYEDGRWSNEKIDRLFDRRGSSGPPRGSRGQSWR